MPSRSWHTKSRHGCGTCKQSKVRCDLTKPICKRCERLERPCSFANEETSFIAFTGVKTNSAKNNSKLPTMSASEINDLELMHHYSTSTCFTMSDMPEKLQIWQYDVPKLAFRHEFLLHGLLALSALHMSHIELHSPSSTFGTIATNHQDIALSSYIPLLQNINEGNSDALFAFSAILGATSFAFLQQPQEQQSSHEFVKSVIAVFDLLRGSTIIAVQGRTWLRKGDLSNLLGPHPFLAREISNCSPDAKASLDAVIRAARPMESPVSDHSSVDELWSIYASSAEQLSGLFPSAIDQSVPMEKVVGWPALAGSPLISKLKEYDPAALIILAHYGAALHVNDHIWYLKGLGNRLVRAVYAIVDKEWQPYLSWPLGRTSM